MSKSYSESYKSAGVDITAGYKSVELMKKHIARTKNEGCLDDIGGFGGCFGLNLAGIEEPVLVKQNGRYGVKLKATAPSLHIMKVDVTTEVSPTVGNEKQGEEMVEYLSNKFQDDPKNILETNIFGRSLNELVKDGLADKLMAIPKDAQSKMTKTLTKMVNENRGGMICILL